MNLWEYMLNLHSLYSFFVPTSLTCNDVVTCWCNKVNNLSSTNNLSWDAIAISYIEQ
jgi:hypothetical protein